MRDVPEPDAFHVLARTTLADDRIRVLKDGDLFGLFDRRGDIHPPPSSAQGLYYGNTRFLSRLLLLVDDHRPLFLGSTVPSENAVLVVDMSNPDITGRADAVPADAVHICRMRFLSGPSAWERIVLHNHSPRRLEMRISMLFGADFEDVFEIRGSERARTGERLDPHVAEAEVVHPYRGLDGVLRETRLSFAPVPDRISRHRADFRVVLEPEGHAALHATVTCRVHDGPTHRIEPAADPTYNDALISMKRRMDEAKGRSCLVRTSSELYDLWLDRSFEDLHMLITETTHGPYPYAGVPWFSTVFGRDGLITALSRLWCDPELARGVLRFLAENQALERDDERDAEPGKILHEMRSGEMAALDEVPFGRYYGSVDATPLFVYLAGAYYERTTDDELLDEIWPAVGRAIAWIEGDGDRDGDGYVEYDRRSTKGLTHQGWKDSHDAIFHCNGGGPEPPIALCEVQAYAYGALRMGARLADVRGDRQLSGRLAGRAVRLRERFDRDFWSEREGAYALALDGRKEPCRVRTSNAGHALLTGLALPERAERLASTLASPELFSGWGVRTLAIGEPRYNPLSYHNGSVWPHDNGLIALGLSHYGFQQRAARILDGMFSASTHFDLHRLPELFCGLPRRSATGPVLYPVACEPQAWAAASAYMLVQAVLGLSVSARTQSIRLASPCLPPSLDWLELRNLRLPGAEVDLRIERHETTCALQVLRREGDVSITLVQ